MLEKAKRDVKLQTADIADYLEKYHNVKFDKDTKEYIQNCISISWHDGYIAALRSVKETEA